MGQRLVADVQSVGSGEPALKYLAACVCRTAFSAERIVADDGRHITFTYSDRKERGLRNLRLAVEPFLHRFLHHVLPKGFQRVRSYGWLSPAAQDRFERILALLDWKQPPPKQPDPLPLPQCPSCQKPLALIGRLPRPP